MSAQEQNGQPRPPDSAPLTDFGYRQVPVREKATLVREHFDRVAPTYDFGNTLLSLGLHHLWKRAAVRAAGLNPGGRVLDLCGGTADLSLLAARTVGPRGGVVLCDINRTMMEAGRGKVARSPVGAQIAFVQGDAEHLPVPANVFDAAMVGFGIRNVTDMEAGFREMHRVLKPGGTLVCLEFSQPTLRGFRALYDFYSFRIMPSLSRLIVGTPGAYRYLAESIRVFPGPEELAERLHGLGFDDVRYRLFTHGIAALHVGKKAAG